MTDTLPSENRPALFLDRDGVINEERDYVHRIEDFMFIEGVFDLCRSAMAAGMSIVVVTNQAGIGRGYYSEDQFHALTGWMRDRFSEQDVVIDAVYFCPFHPDHGIGRYRLDSFDRKPNPGMILRAGDELGLSLGSSILVGDKASDISAARAANLGMAVLLAPPHVSVLPKPDLQAGSLREINKLLFELKTGIPTQPRSI
ncbi:MAG: HAD family hydrolase [Gallionella sp.]